ncbi:MAG: hypothetical protein KDN22_09365 [Verrucomicrobiae bacterium]|nr:hypothetical protein [Verrucomicrobiae bacterium]
MKAIGLLLVGITAFAGGFALSNFWSPGGDDPDSGSGGDRLIPATESAPIGTRVLVKQRGENSFAELDLVNLSVEEVRARLEGLERYPRSRRWLMQRLLIGRWLELDSEGAFAWCREQWTAHSYMSPLLQQWMEIDPEAAMAAWRSLPEGARRTWQLGAMLEGAMKLGPEAYLRCLDQLPVDSLKSPAGVSEMFAELAAMDRERAIARLRELPENLREEASAGIVSSWVQGDPAGAIAYTREMQAGGTRDHCLSKILDSDWALDHPEDAGALLELFSVRPDLVPSSGVSAVFAKLSEGDPMSAVTWAAKYLEPGDAFPGLINREVIAPAIKDSPQAVPTLVASISATIGDAEAAKEWAATLGDGIESRHAQAFAAFAAIENTELRTAALRGLIEDSYGWDFDGVAQAVATLPDADRAQMLTSLVAAPTPGLADAARQEKLLGFADQLPAGPPRTEYLAEVIGSLVSWGGEWEWVHPANAAALLSQYPEAAQQGGDELIRDIAERWVEVADALSDWMPWAEAIADPAQREQAWSGIAQAFANEDTAAASEWLGGLPADDPARDGAVAAFVKGVATRDAEAALVWAETIGAPEMRIAALQSVVDRLAWDNPAHAREIVTGAPVEETIRQQLLYRIDHP